MGSAKLWNARDLPAGIIKVIVIVWKIGCIEWGVAHKIIYYFHNFDLWEKSNIGNCMEQFYETNFKFVEGN